MEKSGHTLVEVTRRVFERGTMLDGRVCDVVCVMVCVCVCVCVCVREGCACLTLALAPVHVVIKDCLLLQLQPDNET